MKKSISKYLIVILFLFIVNLEAAPKLTAILIIVDDYEDAELNNISESVKRDLGTIGGLLNILEKRNLYKVNKIVLRGKDATSQKVKSAINSAATSPDDIFMVFFSGHGGMDSKGTFVVTREGNNLYRSDLEKAVKGKNARLEILITDACSNEVEEIATARSLKTSRSSMEGKFDEIYKKLFGDYEGFMSLSASSEGEYAWSDDNYGGYFTYYFFKEGLTKNPASTWNEIFSSSRQKVVQMFNRMPSEQRNQLMSEGINSQTPKAYSLPVNKNSVTPPQPVKPQSTPLTTSISILNNTNKTIKYFVEVYSSDGNSLINESEGKLSAGKSLKLSENSVIYFEAGNEEVGYELESGSYVFKSTSWGYVDLFPEEENESYNEYEYYTTNELTDIMIRVWEFELTDEYVYFEFYEDGTYDLTDYQDYIIDEGSWDLYEEKYEGEVYHILSLTDSEGIKDEYYIYTEDGYMIELIAADDVNGKVEFLYAFE